MGIATFVNMVNHKDTDMNTGTRPDMDTWTARHKDACSCRYMDMDT